MHRSSARRNRIIESDDEDEETAACVAGVSPATAAAPAIDMEADISTLQPATFSTIHKQQPEPMLHLSWDHKVNLIAGAVINPLIHICEVCDCPILSYGRMIPCKHVFCYDCASGQRVCRRCEDGVARVERAALGTLYMCVHEGSRYTNDGCRRTYLSQRDLQAHINHRHRSTPAVVAAPLSAAAVVLAEKASAAAAAADNIRAMSGMTADLSSSASSNSSYHNTHNSSGSSSAHDPRSTSRAADAVRTRDPRMHTACATPLPADASTEPDAGAATTHQVNRGAVTSSFSVPPPSPLGQAGAAAPAFYQNTPPPSRTFSGVPLPTAPTPAFPPVPGVWSTPPPTLNQPPPSSGTRYYH